jgi:hypothetical protein
MFMHVGWIHILINTYASIGWCTVVERVLGKPRFLAVYLLSGIGGACASALLHRVTSAGASGAMFGIIGATLVLRYRVLGNVGEFVRDRFVRSNVTNMAIWTAIGPRPSTWTTSRRRGLVVGALTTIAATSAPRRRLAGRAPSPVVGSSRWPPARWKPTGDDGRQRPLTCRLLGASRASEERLARGPHARARVPRSRERRVLDDEAGAPRAVTARHLHNAGSCSWQVPLMQRARSSQRSVVDFVTSHG